MKWDPATHSANATDEYVFHQLIPYIGNKRKLLDLIGRAVQASGAKPKENLFVDLFAGTGVVGRYARQLGFDVLANDWEPYAEELNRCYLELEEPPVFFGNRSYESVLDELNALPPREDWVTRHLCPRDDDHFDIAKDRMFYMRKNGLRIDAIRHHIDTWDKAGNLSPHQRAALLAPLLYQCCYNANTSGVFKGFHNGWGGQTGTALYRIKGELALRPALFLNNGSKGRVTRLDAQELAKDLEEVASLFFETTTNKKNRHSRESGSPICLNPSEPNGMPACAGMTKKKGHAFVYLDPPYNQHPYGANYHVLNSVALWDKPALSPRIEGLGSKAAIRTDWRTERRSAYNYRAEASAAYAKLLETLAPRAAWIATSYSTDGTIPLREMLEANAAIGNPHLFTQPYKRYRVSSQRRSERAMNVEFVILTKMGAKGMKRTVDEILSVIQKSAR